MLGETYPVYRLLVIGFGVVLAVAVYFLVERGPLGSVIRATVTDRAMVAALGINTGRVLVGVFAAGAALAAVGGVLAGPILGPSPAWTRRCCCSPWSWWSSAVWARSAARCSAPY